jgi:hypothetical protein
VCDIVGVHAWSSARCLFQKCSRLALLWNALVQFLSKMLQNIHSLCHFFITLCHFFNFAPTPRGGTPGIKFRATVGIDACISDTRKDKNKKKTLNPKSSTLNPIAWTRALGYEIVEMNASDNRNAADVERVLGGMLQNNAITGYFRPISQKNDAPLKKKLVCIMDEVIIPKP